jgi:hypothetical protein
MLSVSTPLEKKKRTLWKGQDDHLPVSPKDASQGSQQGGSQHSSDEESDTDKRMRATVAHDYRGECLDC